MPKQYNPKYVIDALSNNFDRLQKEYNIEDISKVGTKISLKSRVIHFLITSLIVHGIHKLFTARQQMLSVRNVLKEEVNNLTEEIIWKRKEMNKMYANPNKERCTLTEVQSYHLAREKYLIIKTELRIKQEILYNLKSILFVRTEKKPKNKIVNNMKEWEDFYKTVAKNR